MSTIVSVKNVSKRYKSGFLALDSVSLDVKEGEILALLGPNGAGKTTLISIICGVVNKSKGEVLIDGLDNVLHYRKVREIIGLVPQEISLAVFNKVWNSVRYSRGLHGKKQDPKFLEQLLQQLSLLDKKDSLILELSGGMKRRVLIAKALSHQPKILFLDEPTAGVDVELRKDMWRIVEYLRKSGVTIILTTHYIEEAEEIADRIGVINKGKLVLVEDKHKLMKKMGTKHLTISLSKPISQLPEELVRLDVSLSSDGIELEYNYNAQLNKSSVTDFLELVHKCGLPISDISTKQSSLEEIFIDLVKEK